MSGNQSDDSGGVPRVLARNAACHQCRKRKLKCDAVRPACANCLKPRPRADPKGEWQCTWDDSPAVATAQHTTRGRKRKEEDAGSKRARLEELEERVKIFEAALRAQGGNMAAAISGSQPEPTSNGIGATVSNEKGPYPLEQAGIEDPGKVHHDFGSFGTVQDPFSDWSSELIHDANGSHHASDRPTDNWKYEQEAKVDSAFELFWPDWPQDLPSFEIVEHIVNVFFDKVPTLSKMIHRSTFLSHLQLPPNHANFPAIVLLHAILGVTAPHLPHAFLATRAYFPIGTPLSAREHPDKDFNNDDLPYRNMCGAYHITEDQTGKPTDPVAKFQAWHRRKAMHGLGTSFDSGEKLLEAVQTLVIICHIDNYNAWWTDVWMEAGSCIRMSIPLRINESPRTPFAKLDRLKPLLLSETQDPLEQARRDRTWWLAYLTERSSNMATGWADCIADEEITVELPVVQAVFDAGVNDLQGVQTFQSPDLFSKQPPIHSDGFCMHIKALKLFQNVTRFFRQYARGPHSVAGYLSHPSLRQYLSQINAFRLSFPAHLRRPTQDSATYSNGRGKALDVDLVAAILITHTTTLCLAEPVIVKEMVDSDIAKMGLSAIRAILSLLYDITSTSFDLSLLPFSCSYIFLVSAKGMLRFREVALVRGDPVAASVYRSECEVFRVLLQQQSERFPLGARHLKMLEGIIQMQDQSSSLLQERILVDCTKENIFDPQFNPTKIAQYRSPGNQSSNGSSPTTAGSISTSPSTLMSTHVSSPGGHNSPHHKDELQYPSKQFWRHVQSTTADVRRPSSSNLVSVNGPNSEDDSFSIPSGDGVSYRRDPMEAVLPNGSSTQTLQGFDTESWFDIPNLTFDMDQVAALMTMAQENGAMFDLSSFSGS